MAEIPRDIELTTGQVAALLGLPLSRVRFWVRYGLVQPVREVNHTYLFNSEAVERLRYVAARRAAGVSLAQIRREVAALAWQAPQPAPSATHQLVTGSQWATERQLTARPTAGGTPRFLVLANQKGGVGKTTSSVNIGAALAELGQRVLVVDWDPQANASQALGLSPQETEKAPSVFDCVSEKASSLQEVIRPTAVPRLDLAPANIQLSGLELDLAHKLGREFTLRTICHREPLPYDWVIIDTPPTLGLITINALVAGEMVVIPVQAEYLALEGVRQLVNTVGVVRERLNPALKLVGVLITMYDGNDPIAPVIRRRVEEVFGKHVFLAVIPRSAKVVEAQMYGQPLNLFAPQDPATGAYREVARMLMTG
ncbi:MAG: AAA family ATPase [Limnochordales bacterium]|nr:AAA family ATPase [Limnochordales bacterium]